jgi:hypothetical protein
MAGIVPVDRLHHVDLVVRDLRVVARNCAEILGLASWGVRHWCGQGAAFGLQAELGYSTAGSRPGRFTFDFSRRVP